MRLALSSAAAPDLALPDLIGACERRGLGALELVSGHAHGLEPGLPRAEMLAVVAAARACGIEIAAFRAATGEDALGPAMASFAGALRVPVIAPADALGRAQTLLAAEHYAAAGATLLLAVSGEPAAIDDALRLVRVAKPGALGLAWDAAPGPALVQAHETIARAGDALRHVRLLGGGPESAGSEGTGIGPLMAALALGRYPGAVAIAPSTPRFRLAWSAWLGRRGWGCGSAGEAKLTPLSSTTTGAEV